MARTQAERKADTRSRLALAAASVFARRGYQGASVEEVAAEAGLSTGSLYAHFGSKEALFLSLLDEGIPGWAADYVRPPGDAPSLEGGLAGAATHWAEALDQRREVFLLFIEFWAAAVRDPDLRPRLAERYAALRRAGAVLIEKGAAEIGLALPLPADVLASLFIALGDGLALQRLVDPGAAPPATFALALEALFAQRTEPAPGA
jgi:AcrR family transcriptional regulator